LNLPVIPHLEWLPVLAVGLAAFAKPGLAHNLGFATLLALFGAWIFGTAGALLAVPAAGAGMLFLVGNKNRRLSCLGRLAAGGAAMGGAVLYGVFPVPEMPETGGRFQVGTRIVEIPQGGPVDPPLVAQVWYPSRHSAGLVARWLPDVSLAPSFPFHRIAAARIKATVDAPVASGTEPWPVIFYEHGWLGHRNENVAQVLALASRGFVIVAVDHPGQARQIIYRNGKSLPGTLPAMPDFSSAAAIASFENEARRLMADRTRQIDRTRAALAGRLIGDLGETARWSRMGVFGFSFGGSTALNLCASHPDFVAGANQDGLHLDVGEPRGPFLFFDQEMPPWLLEKPGAQENAEMAMVRKAEQRILHAMKGSDRARHILQGTTHLSFTDRLFYSPLPWISRTGNRHPHEVHEAIVGPLASFFQKHLESP
jgi:predicted dienelactone hydrolase